jgi:hypothetical protein
MAVSLATLLGMRFDDPRLAEMLGIDGPVATSSIEHVSYAGFAELGISLVLSDHEHVSAIQLHADRHEGYRQFQGPLPCEVDFAMSRDRLRRTFGKPERSGEAGPVPPLGDMPPWDKWRLGGAFLHAEYQFGAESVRMFSLLSSDS